MKKYVTEFLMRGTLSAWGGPIVLAIVYYLLGVFGVVESFSTNEIVSGIFSVTFLAFAVGGITMIYTIERLPLIFAILIHGCALYLIYIAIYLVNGWLASEKNAILIFTGIFVVGYVIIWLCIYAITKFQADKMNKKLKERD